MKGSKGSPVANYCKTTKDFNGYVTIPGKKHTLKREARILIWSCENFEFLQLCSLESKNTYKTLLSWLKIATVLILSFWNLADLHFIIYQDSEYKICKKREDKIRSKLNEAVTWSGWKWTKQKVDCKNQSSKLKQESPYVVRLCRKLSKLEDEKVKGPRDYKSLLRDESKINELS